LRTLLRYAVLLLLPVLALRMAYLLEPLLRSDLALARSYYNDCPQPEGLNASPDRLSTLELGKASPEKTEALPEPALAVFGAGPLQAESPTQFDNELASRLSRRGAAPYTMLRLDERMPLAKFAALLEDLSQRGTAPYLRIVLCLDLSQLAPLFASTRTLEQAQALEIQAARAVLLHNWPKRSAYQDWSWTPWSLGETRSALLGQREDAPWPVHLWPLQRKSEPKLERARWALYEAELTRVQQAIATLQCKLTIVWLPLPLEWRSAELSEALEALDLSTEHVESARARRRMQDLCAQRGFEFLDLASVWQRASRDPGALIEVSSSRPWHWRASPRGRDTALEALAQLLVKQLPR
jgi:hypothetical protein